MRRCRSLGPGRITELVAPGLGKELLDLADAGVLEARFLLGQPRKFCFLNFSAYRSQSHPYSLTS